MVSTSVRRKLLASTIIAGTLIASPAFAQGGATAAANAADSQPTSTPETQGEGNTIVVTGSLLTNPNLAQTAPVNVTTAEEIQLRQNNVAEEVLRDIPGIVPNVGSAVNNGNGGASFVDLRGLGSFRNIVLLDGNRIVPSGLLGRVDLNNIPLALVERVDALTGGASTTYGADAVSGVVNFITRKDFSGLEISAGEQITERGDGNYARLDITTGVNFDDGRGNAVFSIGYQESDPVYQGDRDFSASAIDSFSGALGGSGTAVPSRFSGTRPIDPATGLPSTNPAVANGGTRQIDPATGRAIANYAVFNFNPYNVFQTPFKRFNMYGAASYQVSDAIEIYTRGLFSKNTVSTIIAPSGAFAIPVTINLNNPYLPAALRQQFCAFNVAPPPAAGAAPTYVPRITPADCAAAALATGPTDPRYRTVTVNLQRRAVELGPRRSDYQTTIFDYRAGLRGALNEHANWNVSGAYGESENNQAIMGYTLNSRFRQALLANNTTTCIDPSNGCVPVNVFGPAGSITPQQAAFLQGNSSTLTRTSLAQARALLNGDFGVSSPFATDAINYAVGGEYRHYRASQTADQIAKSGDQGGAGGASPDVFGGYDVYEAVGELAIPLVQDKPFFDSLSVEAGIRYSHYTVESPNRPKFNTTTWKVGATWQPVRDIKFRGNYAKAVRAPNINELFAPQNTVLTNLSIDPCAGAAPLANANLRAVCLAQGASAGQIGSIQNPTSGQANITAGGNLNLQPETSRSYTFGVVLQPSFFSGFSATVDYYHIKIKDAITVPTPGDIIGACFNNLSAASAANPACTVIRRDPQTGQLSGDPTTTPGLFGANTNQGKLLTDGIDVALNYRTPLAFVGDDVKLALSFVGNYTFRSKFKSNAADPNTVDRDCVGFYSTNCGSIQPKFQWNQRTTLTIGDVDISLLWQHIDKVKYEGTADNFLARGFTADSRFVYAGTLNVNDPYFSGRVVDFNRIKAYDRFDLSTRFGLTKNIDFTLAVQNLFDRTPPITGYNLGQTTYNSGNTFPSTYDALGRKYAVGVRAKF